ncbi:MAG: GGDEF domain-containing protein [Planctomycetota bacterium]|nr:GGDEF domain-containing protein [Planctomycetota bacterium]MDA1212430.1 GGDEF domain-containing protein [Planctomycetota bacterium]
MQHISIIADSLFSYPIGAISTTALAGVCFIHYCWHVLRLQRFRREKQLVEMELNSLASEFNEVQSDRTLVRLENHILREIISLGESDHAITVLLRRFITNPNDAFGFIVEKKDANAIVKSHRGLQSEPQKDFPVENQWWHRLKLERVIALEGQSMLDSVWATSLSVADRRRARELFLIAIGGPNEVTGVMVTTDLYPAGISREQQFELAKRMMNYISGNLKKNQDLATQKVELRAAQEMLSLRQITDRTFESPTKMTEEFLNALIQCVAADRCALYLTKNPSGTGFTPEQARIRCGVPLQANLEMVWYTAEDVIVRNHAKCGQDQDLGIYNTFNLIPLEIHSLIRHATVVTLRQQHGPFGMFCLTKRTPEPFEDWQYRLIEWAGNHLAETMLRSFNFVAVERQARLDGLTQLANRRTFDKIIAREVEWADRFKEDCSLILIDLDRFKLINDNYGHQAGDDVLRVIARVLRDRITEIRCGDRAVLARYGGEELAVLLPGISSAGATRIAESVRAAIEKTPIPTSKGDLKVTASLGTSTYPEHAFTVDDLIGASDKALYHAKELGRNRVVQASELLSPTT